LRSSTSTSIGDADSPKARVMGSHSNLEELARGVSSSSNGSGGMGRDSSDSERRTANGGQSPLSTCSIGNYASLSSSGGSVETN
jgi:hypothetical protein